MFVSITLCTIGYMLFFLLPAAITSHGNTVSVFSQAHAMSKSNLFTYLLYWHLYIAYQILCVKSEHQDSSRYYDPFLNERVRREFDVAIRLNQATIDDRDKDILVLDNENTMRIDVSNMTISGTPIMLLPGLYGKIIRTHKKINVRNSKMDAIQRLRRI